MATTESDVIFDKLAEDVFPYLAELRNNRDINMAMMAPSMIAEDFGLDKYLARNLFNAWIDMLNREKQEEEK